MDDEFARFQAELGALEETEAPGEEPQKAPVEAPTPVPAAPPAAAHVSSAQLSRSAVIARPAAPASVQAGEGRVEYASRPLGAALPRAAPPPPAAYAPLPPPPVLPFAYRAPPLHPPPGAHAAQQHGQQEKVVHVRSAAGEKWVDPTMADWPDNDHRIFVGNLGKEVTDEMLGRAFSKYPTFLKAKAVRHAKSGEHKGYGFVSFGEVGDMVKALKEMDNKYIGNRPCKLKKSTWQQREAGVTVLGPNKRLKTEVVPAEKRRHVNVLEDE